MILFPFPGEYAAMIVTQEASSHGKDSRAGLGIVSRILAVGGSGVILPIPNNRYAVSTDISLPGSSLTAVPVKVLPDPSEIGCVSD